MELFWNGWWFQSALPSTMNVHVITYQHCHPPWMLMWSPTSIAIHHECSCDHLPALPSTMNVNVITYQHCHPPWMLIWHLPALPSTMNVNVVTYQHCHPQWKLVWSPMGYYLTMTWRKHLCNSRGYPYLLRRRKRQLQSTNVLGERVELLRWLSSGIGNGGAWNR